MDALELVDHALDLLVKGEMAAFANLWAEDGVLEYPFAAPGYPPRRDGRAAIADFMRGYPDIVRIQAIPEKMLHQSVDPDVVIAEFEAAGLVIATGQPYRMRYVAVITVRDGEIVRYRDYWSPLAADAMGGADQFVGSSNA